MNKPWYRSKTKIGGVVTGMAIFPWAELFSALGVNFPLHPDDWTRVWGSIGAVLVAIGVRDALPGK